MFRVYLEDKHTGKLLIENFKNPIKAWEAFQVKGSLFGVGSYIRIWFEERKFTKR